jgi:hypothetical protein
LYRYIEAAATSARTAQDAVIAATKESLHRVEATSDEAAAAAVRRAESECRAAAKKATTAGHREPTPTPPHHPQNLYLFSTLSEYRLVFDTRTALNGVQKRKTDDTTKMSHNFKCPKCPHLRPLRDGVRRRRGEVPGGDERGDGPRGGEARGGDDEAARERHRDAVPGTEVGGCTS